MKKFLLALSILIVENTYSVSHSKMSITITDTQGVNLVAGLGLCCLAFIGYAAINATAKICSHCEKEICSYSQASNALGSIMEESSKLGTIHNAQEKFSKLKMYLDSHENSELKIYSGDTISHVAAKIAENDPSLSLGLFDLHKQHTISENPLNEENLQDQTPNNILEKNGKRYCCEASPDFDAEKCDNIKNVMDFLQKKMQ